MNATRKAVLSITLLLQAATAWSQPDTVPVLLHPVPTGLPYFSTLVCRGADTVLVSDGSAIALSTDGGKSFVKTDTDTYNNSYCYLTRFGPLWRLYANQDGPIEISLNLGRTWRATSDTLRTHLTFKNFNSGAGVSGDGRRFWCNYRGVLFSTTDYGGSWDSLRSGGGVGPWCDVSHGAVLVQGDSLVVTANGGKTWETVQTVDSPYFSLLSSSSFTYLSPGILAASDRNAGVFYLSTDTGHSWSFTPHPFTFDYVVAPRDSLWYVPGPGEIFRSTNRGLSWDSIAYTCPNSLGIISFGDSLHGFISDGITMCARTSDGGKSWDCMDTSLYSSVQYSGFDGFTYYGDGYVRNLPYWSKTSDRGKTWVPLFFDSLYYNYIYPVISNHRFYFAYYDRLEWRDEFGKILGHYDLSSFAKPFVKIAPDGALWTGNVLQLAISPDQGATWNDVTAHLPASTIDSQFTFTPAGRLVGFAKTGGGNIFQTTDGGMSWMSDSQLPGVIVDSHHWLRGPILDSQTSMTSYIRTKNAGASWDTIGTWRKGPPSSDNFLAVDSNRWFYGGYYTQDAGASWHRIPGWDSALNLTVMDSASAFSYNNQGLWRLDMPWYVKKPDSVLSSDINSPIISELLLNVHVLENPLDNQTTLHFTLSEASYTKVDVLDVLGREVTLVGTGRILDVGEHQLPVDLSVCTAGTYYLRISLGTGEVRTMKLVKK